MASGIVLFVGNKNLSSWSLRPHLALSHTGAAFEEIVVPLDRPDTKDRLCAVSPTGRVPVLRDGELVVWDSLAICEHVAERFAAQLRRLQVSNDDNLTANHLFRCVVLSDSGDNLPFLVADLDLQFKKLV